MAAIVLTPDTIEWTLIPWAPTIDRDLPLAPDVALLELQPRSPKLAMGQPARSFPLGVAVLTLQTPAMVRTVDGECLLTPDAALLELVPEAPVAGPSDRTLTPDAAVLALLPPSPTVVLAPLVLTPAAAELTLAPQAPALAEERVLTPGAAVLAPVAHDVGLGLELVLAPTTAQVTLHALPSAASVTGDRTLRPGAALLELRAPEVLAVATDPDDVPPLLQVRGRVAISGITLRPSAELQDLGP